MNVKNIFIISFVASSIVLSSSHAMDEKNQKFEKSEYQQPLGLKAACLELLNKQEPTSEILPELFGFITSLSEPKLRLEILKELKPEVIEAASQDLVTFIKLAITNNMASGQTSVEQELIKYLSAVDLKPILDDYAIIFNKDLNSIIKGLLIDKLSDKASHDKLIALLHNQQTPHELKCALVENVPALLKIKYARDLMMQGPVTETFVEKVVSLCKIDPYMIDLLIADTVFFGDNKLLLTNFFIDEHKKHLMNNAFIARLEPTEFLDNGKHQDSSYKVTLHTNKIMVSSVGQPESTFSFVPAKVPNWALSVPKEYLSLIRDSLTCANEGSLEGIHSLSSNGKLLITIFQDPKQQISFMFLVDMELKKSILNLLICHDDFLKIISCVSIDEHAQKVIIKTLDDKVYFIDLPYYMVNIGNDISSLEIASKQLSMMLLNYTYGYLEYDKLQAIVNGSIPRLAQLNTTMPYIKCFHSTIRSLGIRDEWQLDVLLKLPNDSIEKIRQSALVLERLMELKNFTTITQVREYFKVIIENALLFTQLTKTEQEILQLNEKTLNLFINFD